MPYTPIYESRDEWFNHDAAARAFDLVSKMDPDEAEVFTKIVVAEILWDDIAKNQRTLDRRTKQTIAKRAQRLERALDQMVAKGGDSELIEKMREISKAQLTPWDYGWVFDESRIRRDPKTGRFAQKVTYTADKPVPDKIAANVPHMPEVDKIKGHNDADVSTRQKARYQQGMMQVAQFLDAVETSGLSADSVKPMYTVYDTKAKRRYKMAGNETKLPDIDPATDVIEEVEIRPTGKMGVGPASFGLVSALGERNTSDVYRDGMSAGNLQRFDEKFPTFAEDFTGFGADEEAKGSSNARLYGRVEGGSKFLSEVFPNNQNLQIATAFGEFIGHQGPEAEKVLGPKVRRTFYRYRGTEKKPDADIVTAYENATGAARLEQLAPEQRKELETTRTRALRAAQRRKGEPLSAAERKSVVEGITAQALGFQASPEASAEYTRQRGLGVLVDAMHERVPSAEYYDLQLKAGHTPPSEGLIINPQGKIVTQAVGYGDDHYLPFNLKNLKGLKGGYYIRTRSVGGPTTEDIYTGLVSGAQGIVVVSRSGTFVMEFDDTFRGTRRYNDKAARMVSRYGKILDAVQSQNADRQPLEREIRQQIRSEVNRTMAYATPKEKAEAIKRKEREAKMYPTISPAEEEMIQTGVRERLNAGDTRGAKEYEINARNALLERKAYTWKLNGDGYAAAMQSLYEQFPYYFKKPRYNTRDDLVDYQAEPDRGYVKPRYIRPSEAKEGYYDASIAGESAQSAAERKRDSSASAHGKNNADRVDYQNWKHNPNNPKRHGVPQARPAEEPEGTQARGETRGDQARPSARQMSTKERVADEMAREERQRGQIDAALNFRNAVRDSGRVPASTVSEFNELFSAEDDVFRSEFGKYKTQLDQFINYMTEAKAEWGPQLNSLNAYRRARDAATTKKFDRKVSLDSVPPEPRDFEGAAYSPAAEPSLRSAEMERLNAETPFTGIKKPLAEFRTDEDFKKALDNVRLLRKTSQKIKGLNDQDAADTLEVLTEHGQIPDVEPELGRWMREAPQAVDEAGENIHRYWALWKSQAGDLEQSFNRPSAPEPPAQPPKPQGPAPRGPEPKTPKSPIVVSTGQLKPIQVPPKPAKAKPQAEMDKPKEQHPSEVYSQYYDKLAKEQEKASNKAMEGDEEAADRAAAIEMYLQTLDKAMSNPGGVDARRARPELSRLLHEFNDLARPLIGMPDLPKHSTGRAEYADVPDHLKKSFGGSFRPLQKISW